MLRMFAQLVLASSLVAVTLSSSCIDCICQQESGCAPIGCNMDEGSLSCGYFQIKLPYYQDCGEPGKEGGESTEDAWKRCSDDYNCALTCVQTYYNRYKGLCENTGKGECERLARIHNGGPYGCTAQRTDVYWDHIRSCTGFSGDDTIEI